MKAMILAAGKGTRLQPFTNHKPKALYPVRGFTLLQLTILYLKQFGIGEFVINVHHFADQIVEYLEKNRGFGLDYEVSDETEELLDTGGAILKAKPFLEGKDPFILMGTDVLTDLNLQSMYDFHLRTGSLVTLAVKERETSRSLLFTSDYRLTGWRDNRTGELKGDSNRALHALGFSVVHIIQPEIFTCITESGVFPITDLYLRIMNDQLISGYRHDESVWIEFGRTERLEAIYRDPDFHKLMDRY
jgi:NDP-sugar pyrophosphorylase family protein